MRKLLLLLVCALLTVGQLWAQNRTIKGTVLDENGKPVEKASILAKGTKIGTSSESDGTFSLVVPANVKALIITSLNFARKEVNIEGATLINVKLEPSNSKLDEVVVVAYGTQKRKELTGSVATISGSSIQDLPVAGPDQAIQGQASGVQVSSQSGTPGGGISIRIRGVSSLSAGNQPLWVVDGVPVITNNLQTIGVGGQGLNPLSDLNPDDIQSIEILKDAAAASLYGSRANNGVVLVTTKRGANQKTKISFSSQNGIQSVWRKIQPLTGPQYIGLVREEVFNRYGNLIPNPYPNLDALVNALFGSGNGLLIADSAKGVSTNWQDLVFRNAPIQNYELSASGGNEKTKFYFSGGYLNQQGTLIGSGYERYNLRMNLENKISNNFTIGGVIALSRSQNNRLVNDNSIYGVLSTAVLLGSNTPAYNADGSYGRDRNSSIDNPLAVAYEPTIKAITNTLNANTYGEWKIKPWLTFKSTFGVNSVNLRESRFYPTTTNSGRGTNGNGYQANTNYYTLLWNDVLTFRKKIDRAGNHELSALIGNEVQTFNYETINASATNFPGNTITQLDAGAVKSGAGSSATSNALVSFFSKADYSFKGKYLLGASFRRDGSSNFGANNRYGNFYSISGGWNISEEKFLQNNRIISNLKLRGSYGTTGNRNFGDFAALALVSPGFNINQLPGLAPRQLGNPSLSWENRKAADIGLELGLFNRVNITVDVYKNITDDLLFNLPLPLNSGFTSIASNIGQITNKGIELSLNANVVKINNFSWDFNANITWNNNRVTKLSGQPFAAGFASWVQEGYALGSFRGYIVDKVFQSKSEISSAPFQSSLTSPGDLKFKSLTGGSAITGADQTILGNAQPLYFGGFSNIFKYKNFEFSVFAQYQVGNLIYNNTRAFAEGMNSIFGQFATTLNRWTPSNPTTDIRYPRAVFGDPNNNRRTSTRFLEDGSYLRLKTVTIAYYLPQSILRRLTISSMRFYIQGQNLATFTKYSGFDPEISTFGETTTAAGTDFLTVPQARTVSIGLNVTF